MKIGVIGIGAIGGTIARKLVAKGHAVSVANSRNADAVKDFAEKIGATPTDAKGAADGADAIVLAIPIPAMETLPKGLFANLPAGVPIIDTSNYYPGMRDPKIESIEAGMVESNWVSRQLGRPVVKAFNNILAYSLAELGKTKGSAGRLAVAVAGDDENAKRTAMEIVNQVGFDPLDSGSLEQSWRQQPFTPAYCCDYGSEDMRKALDAAVEGEAEKIRENWMGVFSQLPPNPTHDDIIALNRRVNVSSRTKGGK